MLEDLIRRVSELETAAAEIGDRAQVAAFQEVKDLLAKTPTFYHVFTTDHGDDPYITSYTEDEFQRALASGKVHLYSDVWKGGPLERVTIQRVETVTYQVKRAE